MLGVLHDGGGAAGRSDLIERYPVNMPHVLERENNFGMGREEMVRGGAQLVEEARRVPGFFEAIDQARRDWRRETVVHGDVRWDNLLVAAGAAQGPNMNFRLIDWETLGAGDPAWDVASQLSEYVRMWTTPVQARPPNARVDLRSVDPEDPDVLIPFPRESFRNSAAAFWGAYLRRRRMSRAAADELWRRTEILLPLKLFQVALEQTQKTDVTPLRAKRTFKLALGLMEDPSEVAATYFGISEEVAA